MFPGFFSHNASEGHYFTRPELYNRDRPLFRKYVPLCRRVAEAGWEPIPGPPARIAHVYVERFGDRLFTVFNDSAEPRGRPCTVDLPDVRSARELVSGRQIAGRTGRFDAPLAAEDVAVIEVD